MTDYIHTLGDGTLDNFYWMVEEDGRNTDEAEKNCVKGRLKEALSVGYEVVSHAYDGFSTSSVLKGDSAGRNLDLSLDDLDYRAYLRHKEINPDSYSEQKQLPLIYPLKNLKNAIESHSKATHYVVISLGAYDFRNLTIFNMFRVMFRDISQIQERYLKILQEVNDIKKNADSEKRNLAPIVGMYPQLAADHEIYPAEKLKLYPILVLQPRLNANHEIYPALEKFGQIVTAIQCLGIAGIATFLVSWARTRALQRHFVIVGLISATGLLLSTYLLPFKETKKILSGQSVGMAIFERTMEKFYRPILAQAKKEGTPILDLPNTFDPHEELYAANRPNEKGSTLVAEGISFIIKKHDFTQPSQLYYKLPSEPSYKAYELKPDQWKVSSAKKGN